MQWRTEANNWEKETWYKIYLKTEDQQKHIKYEKLKAEIRKLTRWIRRDEWDKFAKSLESDLRGPQRRGFTILKKVQLVLND
jgi:hypothetical protein